MGIFNYFKEKKEKAKQDAEQKAVEKEAYENRDVRGYCSMCGKVIETGEGYTKLLGKYYHRPCWKQMKKEGW